MISLLAIIRKEWQLLWHDKPSLLIIFVMPMCLVLVLTLLEASDPANSSQMSVMLINNNTQLVGKAVDAGLDKIGFIKVNNTKKSELVAKKEVAQGSKQALIVIPKKKDQNIKIILDPTMPKSVESALVLSLKMILQQAHFQQNLVILSRKFRTKLNLPENKNNLNVTYASMAKGVIKPSEVQQIVPAWTLFGMFLIIIPLGSVIVKEREQGILQRLYVTPTSKLNFLFGRVFAFSMVNIIQFILMFALGVYILPLFDLPSLNITGETLPLLATAVAIALSATGFGILVGTYAKTFEQTTAIGPILIIIAAAVGGILAPVYLMPDSLRQFTNYSPMNWGQHAFLESLVRHSDFAQLVPDLSKLIIFFIITMILVIFKQFAGQKFSGLFRR